MMDDPIWKIRSWVLGWRLKVRNWGNRHIRSRIPDRIYWLYTDVDAEVIGVLDAFLVQLIPIYLAYIGRLWIAIGTAVIGRVVTSRLSARKRKRDREQMIEDAINRTEEKRERRARREGRRL
ncbi:hypothetical protein [Natrinema pallidum]|uniref:hypothetical protein n=1 Tax=Natrinema pallidum TaxID=69527 RepID=UPI00137606D8|nr:hypothetical protein [Natrinema pallidum]